MKPYQSPDITGHEDAIKAVLLRFLADATRDPDFNARLAVHEATAYVMHHLPPGVTRVDGSVIAPLLTEVIAGLLGGDEPEPVVARIPLPAVKPVQPVLPKPEVRQSRLGKFFKKLWK